MRCDALGQCLCRNLIMKKGGPGFRILLAAREIILLRGLRKLLELEPDIRVVSETQDGREVARLAAETMPDIAIIDLRMIGIPGLEVLRRVMAADRLARVLLLASVDDKEEIAEGFRIGARAVVLKESSTKVLIRGIHSVIDGKYWVGDRAFTDPCKGLNRLTNPSKAGPRPKTFGLTKRELEVVSAVVSGHSNKEIARKFSISEDTVKHHVTNIFDKVGVYNRLELALFAIHNGIVGSHSDQK